MGFSRLSGWLTFLNQSRQTRSSPEIFDHIRSLIDQLHLLSYSPRVILVSGTNGKGSCVSLLERIYLNARVRVGTFTSPHVLKFNERIRLLGKPVNNQSICDTFNCIERMKGDFRLSYFQYAFLAALFLFQQAELDLLILEVGIGGRSDIVNLVEPDLSIITNVALDHCELLGETRELIGAEKAGIMRKGKPVICGDIRPPESIFIEANRIGADLYTLDRDFFYHRTTKDWNFVGINNQWQQLPLPSIELSNAATALMAVSCLHSLFPVNRQAIVQGLRQVHLLGRQALILFQGKKILIDVAHNPEAVALLVKKIRTLNVQGNIYAIVGFQQDKDITRSLLLLKNLVFRWSLCSLSLPRGAQNDYLASILSDLNIHHYTLALCMEESLSSLLSQMEESDLLVIFGSFLIASQAYSFLNKNKFNKK